MHSFRAAEYQWEKWGVPMKKVYMVGLTGEEKTRLLELVGKGEFEVLSRECIGEGCISDQGTLESEAGSKREETTAYEPFSVEDARMNLERLYQRNHSGRY